MSDATLPADDLNRQLVVANPDDPELPHIGLAGDTYTVLLSEKDTSGQYCPIDMHVPPGGGPPPHRHDFEESFTVVTGEIEVKFRDQTRTLRKGQTANIPANAPHQFRNSGMEAARLLCICSPAGQDEFFLAVGVPVAGRTTSPPILTPEQQEAAFKRSVQLAPKYRTELLTHD